MRAIAAAALAVALLAVTGAGAGAAPVGGEITNDEVVLATLDPSGLPLTATLISRVTSLGGPVRTVEDPASTVDVGYRDRRGSPQTTAGGVLVEVGGAERRSVLTEALFDKPLPVALHAQYRLAGAVVNPQEIIGASGDIEVRYTATNTTAQVQQIKYTDAGGIQRTSELPVFVPFAGTLQVTVPRGTDVVAAPGASSATTPDGDTVLRFDVMLAPPAGDFTAEAVVSLEAPVGAATPAAVLSVAPVTSGADPVLGFAGELIEGSLAGSRELAAGVGAIDDAAGALADGSAALAAGAAGLAAGQRAFGNALGAGADGSQTAATGARALADGLVSLTAGLQRLSGDQGLPAAAAGAAQLADAASLLSGIVGSSADGKWAPDVEWPAGGWPADAPPWPPDVQDLPQWADALARLPVVLPDLSFRPSGSRDGTCDLDRDGDGTLDSPVTDLDCVPTLVQSLRLLSDAAGAAGRAAAQLSVLLGRAASDLAAAAADARSAAQAADAAALAAAGLRDGLCGLPPELGPDDCARLVLAAEQAAAAADSAGAAADAITAAGPDLAGAGAIGTGLAVGLPLLAVLLDGVTVLAEQVGDGLRSGSAQTPGLVEGLTQLQAALDEAAQASAALASGAATAAAGADALADGAGELAGGLSAALAGAARLTDGADQVSGGADDLADGADRLQSQGTAPALAAIIDGSADPALGAAYLTAVDARAAEALPYGPPEGGVGNAAYVLQMPARSEPGGGLRYATVGLAALIAAGLAAALVRRVRR